MSVKVKVLIAALYLFFSLAFVGFGLAQGQSIDKAKFGDGALEAAAETVEGLLQLKWSGRNVALSRDLDGRLKKKKKNELKIEFDKLVKSGHSESQARKLAEFRAEDKFGLKSPNAVRAIERAFFAIASHDGRATMRKSGDDQNRMLNFPGHLLAGKAVIRNDYIKFEFKENSEEERRFKISDNDDGQFKFEFIYKDIFVRLKQSKAGNTQLIWIDNDQVDVYVGDSFSNFIKRNPKVADTMLLPLFRQLGIQMPSGAPDP